MRLIDVKTFELKEFLASDIPHYAILSHRWEKEEVTFQDLSSGKGEGMIGWKKIEGCCRLALRDKLEWVWIDSCCIDKTSSAELSEAINSMFRWYRDAEVCYAYLSDVSGPLEEGKNIDTFRSSQWFTRGWTLQELLAPDELKFLDKNWDEIGTKESLCETLSQVTGIKHLFNFEDASIAQKMSWAARRETTRFEDQAYCLLGIFGVNMPPLYGEGSSAFMRLQLEIMKISNDESLFAWVDRSVRPGGLLATSPLSFRYGRDIKSVNPPQIERRPYSMTNKGLEISFNLQEVEEPALDLAALERPREKRWLAQLNCVREGNDSSLLTIILSRDTTSISRNYQRDRCYVLINFNAPSSEWTEELGGAKAKLKWEKVWINQPQIHSGTDSYCYFKIDATSLYLAGWERIGRPLLHSEFGRWGPDAGGCIQLKLSNSSAGVILRRSGSRIVMLQLSCVGKIAHAALRVFRPKEENYFLQDVFTWLKIDKEIDKGSEEIVAGEARILKGMDSSGQLLLEASISKEGIPGNREKFVVRFL
jgi:hypothetical protein